MRSAAVRKSIVGALFLVLAAGQLQAQINSLPNNVNLFWHDPENLHININFVPGLGQFLQDGGAVTPTTAPINITAVYNGMVNRQSLTLYAYFADPARALANASGSGIPAANIQATIEGVGTTTFSQPSPFSAASVQLARTEAVATNGTGTLPATFTLSILGTNYVPGAYNGTLFFQAQAI
jgi:hypothetical protein